MNVLVLCYVSPGTDKGVRNVQFAECDTGAVVVLRFRTKQQSSDLSFSLHSRSETQLRFGVSFERLRPLLHLGAWPGTQLLLRL